MSTRHGARCTKYEQNRARLSLSRSPILPSLSATASSKTFFARSTATVVECIRWTPLGEGFSCDYKLSLAHRCRTAIQEESISSLEGSVRVGGVAAGAGRQCAPAALIGRFWADPSTSPLGAVAHFRRMRNMRAFTDDRPESLRLDWDLLRHASVILYYKQSVRTEATNWFKAHDHKIVTFRSLAWGSPHSALAEIGTALE